MTVARNIKVGLFAIGGVAAAVIAAIAIGLHAVTPEQVEYHTYFDESVQGLDVGSPVKYRGVLVGSVKAIGFAPDRKHIAVVLGIGASQARQLDLAESTSHLRTELEVQGLTGLKDVEIEVVEPAENPPPALPFSPPTHYIPSRKSLLTGISGDLEVLAHELPELVSQAKVSFGKLDRVLDDVHEQQLVARAGEMVDRVSSSAAAARRLLASVDDAHLPERVSTTLASADNAITDARGVIKSVGTSLGDVGRRTTSSVDDLDRTIRELGDAARAVRELAEDIDREPDILLKGRGRSSRK
jgi:ABC-type transporter Mla subunit MlaD